MKVLGLASYPVEAAATRYRLEQFVGPLADRGINLQIRPFVDSALFSRLHTRERLPGTAIELLKAGLLRLTDAIATIHADVVLVQREAMMFGPPVIEWLATRLFKRPMVLDLDDATYVSYSSPTYGAITKRLKWFSKTDDLINWATVVICGNRSIAQYVAKKHVRARIIPTVVNTNVFCPQPFKTPSDSIVLGWIGTHSTFPYLELIFPVLTKLAARYDFTLKIVGSGKSKVTVPGLKVENVPWKLEREIPEFQSIDIGLYPIDASLYGGKWAFGKSGFKAIQYMAVGVPYVATPVGGAVDIGKAGITHLFAETHDDWYSALATLIGNPEKRREMGAAGRQYAVSHYALDAQADKLAAVLREAVGQS